MTLRHLSLALMLAGCSLIKTSTSTSLPTGSSSSSSAPTSSSDQTEATSETRKKPPELIGLPIEEAKKQIKAYGFDGEIEVIDLYEFDKDCKADTVCRFDSQYWHLNQDHRMALYKNKAISIAVPE